MSSIPLEKQKNAEAPLTQGSLWKAIWVMSWPLVLTTIAGAITAMVDIHVAGFLGSTAQAAVGLSEQVLFIFMVFIMSVSVGTTALVSRAFGAGDESDTIDGTAQSLTLAVAMGCVLAVAVILIANTILPLFCNEAAAGGNSNAQSVMLAQGKLYLSIFGIFLLPFSIINVISAAFRAIGDARTPLTIVAISAVICIGGDYLTVLGNWPLPGLGLRGIAYSAIAGNTAAACLAVWRLSLSPLSGSLSRLMPISLAMMKRVIQIGIPSACQRLSYSAAVFVMFFILSRCPNPVQAIASWTIGIRVESMLFMPLMALSMAVASIVGQNLGAHEHKRAFQAGWHVTWIGVVLMLFLGAAVFAGAGQLAHLMSHDPKTIEYTTSYLQINALAEPFLAVAMVLSGALQGAGDTRSPMWISIFCNWLVRFPILWLLALQFKYGPTGAWLAMAASIVAMAVLCTWRYQSGRWLKVRV
jgi:putative MATE family efflux protein